MEFATHRLIAVGESISEYLNWAERYDGEKNGTFRYLLSDQYMLTAMVAYAKKKPVAFIRTQLSQGVREFVGALESGYRPSHWDVWYYPLYALAIGDEESAQLLASRPEEEWVDVESSTLHWLGFQSKTVFALIHNDPQAADHWCGIARGMIFEESRLPEGLGDAVEEVRNAQLLLEALLRCDSPAFDSLLGERLVLRMRSFQRQGTNSPLRVMDLSALGLCRLAKNRAISVATNHDCLPHEILEIA